MSISSRDSPRTSIRCVESSSMMLVTFEGFAKPVSPNVPSNCGVRESVAQKPIGTSSCPEARLTGPPPPAATGPLTGLGMDGPRPCHGTRPDGTRRTVTPLRAWCATIVPQPTRIEM